MGLRCLWSALVVLWFILPGLTLAQDASYDPPPEQNEAKVVVPYHFVSALAVAEDGTLVWGKLEGPVYRLGPGDSPRRVLFEPHVTRGPEWGLTGIALAPDFVTSGTIFVAYVTGEPGTNVSSPDAKGTMFIVRVTDEVATTIYTYNATRSHNSGRLLVHDGLLYVTNGDHKRYDRLADPGAEEGKILRMTFDGAPAPGNPHETDPSWHPFAFTMGHRNPFGIAWDPTRGVLVETEVGNHSDEELNILIPGGHYGWPTCAGRCDPPIEGFIDAILVYPRVVTPVGVAPIGGEYYVATYNWGEIRRTFETAQGWRDEIIYVHDQGLISIAAAADGNGVYFGAWNGLFYLPIDAPETVAPPVEEPLVDVMPVTAPPAGPRESDTQSEPSPEVRPPAQTPGLQVGLVLVAMVLVARSMSRR